MMKAIEQYEKLVQHFEDGPDIAVGQMFGKRCIKVNGQAFIAQHQESVVFKLSGQSHAKALARPGAMLWDPSGKGRPMKEWVAPPASEAAIFSELADASIAYLSGGVQPD
jgi:hypothetical protein